MLANAVGHRRIGDERIDDEQMSWRAAAALWIGLAGLGWMSLGALVSSLV